MSVIREWLFRLWGTFRKTPEDGDMEEELRLHLELAAEELQRRGLSRQEAMRQARLQGGAVAQAMEQRRDQRGLPWLEDLLQDLRYGLRTLRRSPMFTAVALVTLTLAVGANTAIFSLVDPLLFRDLPVRDPGSLVKFTYRYPGDPSLNLFSVDASEHYRDRNTVFSEMAGFAPLVIESPAGGEPISAEVVTGNFFAALGVRPALGRLLELSDDKPAAVPVAVVSWQYWKHRFNGEARVLGAVIDTKDRRVPLPVHATIVGVAAPGFSGVTVGYQPDVWISSAWIPDVMRSAARFALFARLKPGVSIDQARAEMRVLDRDRIEGLARTDPTWRQVTLDVTSARAGLSTPLHDQFGGPLRALMATVGILLLIACANLGGLLLARGAARQHEMAVRVSLGAGRFRILRQVLTESLALAAAGSLLGLAGARLAAGLLMRIMTSGTRSLGPPPAFEIPLDGRVLLFTIAVTLFAALAFGAAPAVAAFVSSPAPALRAGAAGGRPRSRTLFGRGLVIAQVALSLALLSVSQLYIGHLVSLRDRSLGFDRNDALLVSVDTSRSTRSREQLAVLYGEALRRLQALPGVRAATASGMTPISGAAGSRFLRAEGFEEPPQAMRRVSLNVVAPGYFATYATPLLAGRDFRDADAEQPRRVIVNQALARHYFQGRDPIARRVWFDNDRDSYEIVGVVGDAKYQDVREAAPPIAYLFYAPSSRPLSEFTLRTAVPPATMAGDARRVIAGVLGDVPVGRVITLAEQVDASIVPERLLATLSGFFGVVGALLAAVGLYGLFAFTVARRVREIGIRMALGATRGDVMRMVLTSAFRLVLAGVIVGVPAASWGKRLAASMLEQLSPGGLMPIAAGIASLFVVALVAAYLPARRATRVDPVIALRSE